MPLVFVGAVTNFAEAVDEDGTRQAVAGFTLVQLLSGRAAQVGILDPVEREQGAFQSAQLTQRGGDAVLARVEQSIQHVQCLAGGRRDELGEERRVAVRKVRVDLEAGAMAVMGIETAGVATEAGGLEELPVGG